MAVASSPAVATSHFKPEELDGLLKYINTISRKKIDGYESVSFCVEALRIYENQVILTNDGRPIDVAQFASTLETILNECGGNLNSLTAPVHRFLRSKGRLDIAWKQPSMKRSKAKQQDMTVLHFMIAMCGLQIAVSGVTGFKKTSVV